LTAYRQRNEDPRAWLQAIAATCTRLWEELVGPVEAFVRTLGVSPGTQLVLLAPGLLGTLPLHAATRFADGSDRCLADDYVVSYAPSIAALGRSLSKARQHRASADTALVVTVPPKTLRFAAVEGAAVLSAFDSRA